MADKDMEANINNNATVGNVGDKLERQTSAEQMKDSRAEFFTGVSTAETLEGNSDPGMKDAVLESVANSVSVGNENAVSNGAKINGKQEIETGNGNENALKNIAGNGVSNEAENAVSNEAEDSVSNDAVNAISKNDKSTISKEAESGISNGAENAVSEDHEGDTKDKDNNKKDDKVERPIENTVKVDEGGFPFTLDDDANGVEENEANGDEFKCDPDDTTELNGVKQKKPITKRIRKSMRRLSRSMSRSKKLGQVEGPLIEGQQGSVEYIKKQLEHIKMYDFMFENIAFEGGGAKMVGYVGTIQALEELGVLQRIKRMSGTSGGAIVAMLLAIGMDSAQMKECLSENIRVKLMDSPLGKFAFLPNIMSKFGWNPATKFTDYVRGLLKKKTGQESMTFKEVYNKYGTELCIVATNITTMSVEYFHPKTTPDFDIVTAVRCSVSLPGYLQPVRVENDAGMVQYYLDGGLVCNFPLHTFDGWYLSMKFEDSFFNKLGGDERPFGTFNPQTLGVMLMSSGEGDFMQDKLHLRQAHVSIDRPNTALAKKRAKKCDENLVNALEKAKLLEAGHQFLNALRDVDYDNNALISMDEFKAAFEKFEGKDGKFQPNQEQVEMLFGKDFTWEKAFAELDKLQNGTICIEEFLWFMQKKGIRFRALLEGGNMMTSIDTFADFFEVTFNTILNTTRKAYYKKKDIDRTVSIYVDYIDTTDFDLEEGDKNFLVKQGIIGALTYLEELVERKNAGKLSPDIDAIVVERSKPLEIHDIGGIVLVDNEPAEDQDQGAVGTNTS